MLLWVGGMRAHEEIMYSVVKDRVSDELCVFVVVRRLQAVRLLRLVANAVDNPAELADEVINAETGGDGRDEKARLGHGDVELVAGVQLCLEGRPRLRPLLSLMVVLGKLVAEEGCLS